MTAVLHPRVFPDAHSTDGSQAAIGVGEPNLPQPSTVSTAKRPTAAAINLPDAQIAHESHGTAGVGEPNLPQPKRVMRAKIGPAAATNIPDAHVFCDSHLLLGVGDQTGTETAHGKSERQHPNSGLGPILADPMLAMCADIVDDLEKVKIANQNRLRTLTDTSEFGHHQSPDHPDVQRLAQIVGALDAAEHQAVLNLQRVMRKHPLGQFVKSSKGIGEKQAARLLASIRDPYWNDLHNRPRTLRELNRFCGMDVVNGVAPSKRRGERVHWSPQARMRLWLIASKCVMVGHGGPYRAAYDNARIKYDDAVHANECKQCGPKGTPAQPGSPLSKGHQHARAIRKVAKEILSDLWTTAKTIHEENQK